MNLLKREGYLYEELYKGEMDLKGKRKGFGWQVFLNGFTYIGYWENDVPSGEGILIYCDGTYLFGQFKEGNMEVGKVQFKSGASFEGMLNPSTGEFLSGYFTFKNGVVIKGKWRNGVLIKGHLLKIDKTTEKKKKLTKELQKLNKDAFGGAIRLTSRNRISIYKGRTYLEEGYFPDQKDDCSIDNRIQLKYHSSRKYGSITILEEEGRNRNIIMDVNQFLCLDLEKRNDTSIVREKQYFSGFYLRNHSDNPQISVEYVFNDKISTDISLEVLLYKTHLFIEKGMYECYDNENQLVSKTKIENIINFHDLPREIRNRANFDDVLDKLLMKQPINSVITYVFEKIYPEHRHSYFERMTTPYKKNITTPQKKNKENTSSSKNQAKSSTLIDNFFSSEQPIKARKDGSAFSKKEPAKDSEVICITPSESDYKENSIPENPNTEHEPIQEESLKLKETGKKRTLEIVSFNMLIQQKVSQKAVMEKGTQAEKDTQAEKAKPKPKLSLCQICMPKFKNQTKDRDKTQTNEASPNDIIFFSGKLIEGKKEGLCFIKYRDGTLFSGSFKNNLRDGEGVIILDKITYSGIFSNDDPVGCFTKTVLDKVTKGVFKENKFIEIVTRRIGNLEVEIEETDNEVFTGKGTIYLSNYEIQCNFKDNEIDNEQVNCLLRKRDTTEFDHGSLYVDKNKTHAVFQNHDFKLYRINFDKKTIQPLSSPARET